MKLRRTISTYQACNPAAMATEMSDGAKRFAFEDMRADLLTMAKLLCEAGYPRLGTEQEHQSMQQFAEKVQKLISHAEAVEL
jgi:hypothetical protein